MPHCTFSEGEPLLASMKAPPKRKGNGEILYTPENYAQASMKAPPKRKGNPRRPHGTDTVPTCLNESPSEKEGKYVGC